MDLPTTRIVGQKKQTIIVAAGLAIAIALVMIVNSLATGVRDAQAEALESVYGVGTDLTVTGAVAEPGEGGGPGFEFEEGDEGTGEDGETTLSQSQLRLDQMRGTLESSTTSEVAELSGVASATGTLALTNSTFSGEMPPAPAEDTESGEQPAAPPGQGEGSTEEGGGFGGGSFDVNSFSVLGVDPAATEVGPLSSVTISEGRALSADDAGSNVAVLDATYASSAEVGVGDVIEVGGTEMEIVGLATSDTSESDTASDVYIPLDVAQELAGAGDVVSTIYVQAESSSAIDNVSGEISAALPDATVNSQSDLASSVSGSLSSATSMINNLGRWLSIVALGVALVLAVLFTISGVTRRTREFGTLKAIGWSDGRVVSQVMGESMVQGLIGGVGGIGLGLLGVWIINLISPTISGTQETQQGPGGGGGGPFGEAAQATADVVLNAPVTTSIVLAAVGMAVLGGLVAGGFGGWRAARLSPAAALRAV